MRNIQPFDRFENWTVLGSLVAVSGLLIKLNLSEKSAKPINLNIVTASVLTGAVLVGWFMTLWHRRAELKRDCSGTRRGTARTDPFSDLPINEAFAKWYCNFASNLVFLIVGFLGCVEEEVRTQCTTAVLTLLICYQFTSGFYKNKLSENAGTTQARLEAGGSAGDVQNFRNANRDLRILSFQIEMMWSFVTFAVFITVHEENWILPGIMFGITLSKRIGALLQERNELRDSERLGLIFRNKKMRIAYLVRGCMFPCAFSFLFMGLDYLVDTPKYKFGFSEYPSNENERVQHKYYGIKLIGSSYILYLVMLAIYLVLDHSIERSFLQPAVATPAAMRASA